MRILASDIGGTNARFAFYEAADSGALRLAGAVTFPTKESSLPQILSRLASGHPEGFAPDRIDAVSVAAAGPVEGGSVSLTNASFSVTEAALAQAFPRARVRLMNDFEAQGWAAIAPDLARGFTPIRLAPLSRPLVAVLGAGTGFGVALAQPGRGVLPTEMGHAPFPFEPGETAFERMVRSEHNGEPAIFDWVLSGPGLHALARFLTHGEADPHALTADPAFDVTPLCAAFARFYGRACRAVAFSMMPGKIVITGGIAAAVPGILYHDSFTEEFLRASGRHREFLESVAIVLNAREDAGLAGAAYACLCDPQGAL